MSEEPVDMSRRKFMEMGTVGVVAASTGSFQLENPDNPQEGSTFQAASHLIGPEEAIPEAGGEFFDRKKRYAYVYTAIDSGARYKITQDTEQWEQINPSIIEKNGSLYHRTEV